MTPSLPPAEKGLDWAGLGIREKSLARDGCATRVRASDKRTLPIRRRGSESRTRPFLRLLFVVWLCDVQNLPLTRLARLLAIAWRWMAQAETSMAGWIG